MENTQRAFNQTVSSPSTRRLKPVQDGRQTTLLQRLEDTVKKELGATLGPRTV